MTEQQRTAMRAAASVLLGHFRASAAVYLRRAGPAAERALQALEEGEDAMAVRRRIERALAASETPKQAARR